MSDRIGIDFSSSGSVMSTQQLQEQRRKRGECLTCGQKCYQKKLFKAIPITIHGQVLNGRCLKCNPLEVKNEPADPDPHPQVVNCGAVRGHGGKAVRRAAGYLGKWKGSENYR